MSVRNLGSSCRAQRLEAGQIMLLQDLTGKTSTQVETTRQRATGVAVAVIGLGQHP